MGSVNRRPPRRLPPVAPGRIRGPSPACRTVTRRRLLLLLQQTLVDERGDPFDHIDRCVTPGVHHRLRRLQGEATDEDREAAEEDLLPLARGGRSSRRRRSAASAAGPGHPAAHRSARCRAAPSSSSTSRAANSLGVRCRTLAAASSIASGRPSRRRQMASTAAAFASVRLKSGRAAWARLTKSRTAGDKLARSAVVASAAGGNGRGGTGKACSPETRSNARLVTKHVRCGHRARSSATSGAASTTCSKLSRMSRASLLCKKCAIPSRSDRWPASRTSSACAIAERTRAGSRIEASGTNQMPSGKSSGGLFGDL